MNILDLDWNGEEYKEYEHRLDKDRTVFLRVYFRQWGRYSLNPENDSSEMEPVLEEFRLYDSDGDEIMLTTEQEHKLFKQMI